MLIFKALIRAFFIGTAILLIVSPTLAFAEDYIQLNANVLLDLVNKHREELNLSPFQKDEKICQIAKSRAPELHNEIFVNGPMHKGLRALSLPYRAIENIIYIKSEQEALNWWLNSYVHKKTIEGNYKYSCLSCLGQACSEIFTNFVPK